MSERGKPERGGRAESAASEEEQTHLLLDPVCLEDESAEAAAEGSDAGSPSRAARESRGRDAAPSDEARTHLLLNPVCLEDEGAEGEAAVRDTAPAPRSAEPTAPLSPSAKPAPRQRQLAADEARTHLLLDPVCLEDEDDERQPPAAQARPSAHLTPSAPPRRVTRDSQPTHLFIAPIRPSDAARAPAAQQRAAEAPTPTGNAQQADPAKAAPSGEARTHLMLGPMLLKDAPIDVPPAADGSRRIAGPLLRVGEWVDARMHDHWTGALAAGALARGILAPLVDGRAEEPLHTASVLASLGALVGLAAFGLAELSKLRCGDGRSYLQAAWARLRGSAQLLALDVRELRRSARDLQLFLWGRMLALVGLVGWVGVSCWSLLALFYGVPHPPGALAFPSGCLLLAGLAAMALAKRSAVVAPAPEELEESVAAATRLAAIVDLSESLPPSFIDGHTPLHRILIALAQWRGGRWPDAEGYRAALERHFQRQLPASRIESEKWLGRARGDGVADLFIDGMVLIEVSAGFSPTRAARAIGRVSELASKGSGKPVILVIFDGAHEAVFQSAARLSLLELHDRFPLVSVRMPQPEE